MYRLWACAMIGAGFALAASPSWARDRIASLAQDLALAAAASGKERVAVVPFAALDEADPVDGRILAERILTVLVQCGRVGVFMREIGAAKAQALVAGTITDDGDKLEVQARLIDVDTGQVLFAVSEKVKPDWRGSGSYGFLSDPCVAGGATCREERREDRRLEREIRSYERGDWIIRDSSGR
jgi:TolB-like protein